VIKNDFFEGHASWASAASAMGPSQGRVTPRDELVLAAASRLTFHTSIAAHGVPQCCSDERPKGPKAALGAGRRHTVVITLSHTVSPKSLPG